MAFPCCYAVGAMESRTSEILWCSLRASVLLGFSLALRKSSSTVSTCFSAGGLLCWCFYDLRRQLQRQREELWKQMAIPMRVCAYAEQLGERVLSFLPHGEPQGSFGWLCLRNQRRLGCPL
eukprot:Skav222116  [mRNA]  locus=scaffold1181:456496:461845:- [translate_table: standard]